MARQKRKRTARTGKAQRRTRASSAQNGNGAGNPTPQRVTPPEPPAPGRGRARLRHLPVTVVVAALASLAMSASGCDTASTTDPQPPSGGQAYVLDYNAFVTAIDPILTARGCDNASCHGGGIRGTFELSPAGDKNVDLDFEQACLQVNGTDPAASALLMKPLDPNAGGAAHAADPQQYGFTSTNDPDYQSILAWIEAGEYR